MRPRPGIDQVFAGPVILPPLGDLSDLTNRQVGWRADFSDRLYGPVPPPPDSVEVRLKPLTEGAEHVIVNVRSEGRQLTVDAALWRPPGNGPVPLIAGLDFTGPIGILEGDDFPLDARARVFTRPKLGASDSRLHDKLRGSSAHRWPIKHLMDNGYAVLISCYGSWVPDDPGDWTTHGLQPLLRQETCAISLWAWAFQRLIDAAGQIDGIQTEGAVVAGHSRLGKAALWAAANDTRIAAVLANNSGCGGAAPHRHAIGETLKQMSDAYPPWIKPSADPGTLDQHHLMACIAPRKLYVSSADQDTWADPVGSYLALKAASAAWPDPPAWPSPEEMWTAGGALQSPLIGHHLRPGGHDLLPSDWRHFLAFLKSDHADK